ncbi:amino acid ABC transporter permease [Sporanaerobacter acetigenes]|uniref:amino acid ABC transporter permease n=1 Tax=Sporanaerobacter acetigenes TaxID=165813 RepID=UPI001054061D|nr:amino acid ABC transporter permease [Sporanaerobacter acetigenes]
MFKLEAVYEVLIAIVKTLPTTLFLSLLALVFSLILAIVLALLEYFDIKYVQKPIKVYTSFFRGTPLVAQLFFFYYGLPNLIPSFKEITGFTAAVITLSLNSSAYMKEIIRGALMSVEKGQIEAGLSIGLTNLQTTIYVVFPQAIRVAIPSLSNSFIDILKGSAMGFTVGVFEITAAAQLFSASTFRFFEGYTSLLIVYWILDIALEKIQSKIEIKLKKSI